jgi:hypothetical protein
MAINVETGLGLASSETYCSVAYADAYHLARGAAPWATLTTSQKEEALRRASDYFEAMYSDSFGGYRKNKEQALTWPRVDAYLHDYYVESDTIPDLVVKASAELAYKAASGDLSPDLTQGVKREKVGVLEVEYDGNTPQYTRFRAIDNILSPLLVNHSGSAQKKVVRV